MNKALVEKCVRYFFTGGVAAIVDVGIFSALTGLGFAVLPSAAISFSVAAVTNYILTCHFVFRRSAALSHFLMFFCVAVIGLVVNVGITVLASRYFLIPPVMAKIVGIGTAFLLNLFLNARFVFAPRQLT